MLNLRFARANLLYLDERQQQGPHQSSFLELAARQELGPFLLLELVRPSFLLGLVVVVLEQILHRLLFRWLCLFDDL
jgi:hypothetical protein